MSLRSEVIRIFNDLVGAGRKITELPAVSTPLAGTELLEIVQSGVNKKVTASSLSSGGTGVQTIVAGANVTVDDTDPQNPVVSSSDGVGVFVPLITEANTVISDDGGGWNFEIGQTGTRLANIRGYASDGVSLDGATSTLLQSGTSSINTNTTEAAIVTAAGTIRLSSVSGLVLTDAQVSKTGLKYAASGYANDPLSLVPREDLDAAIIAALEGLKWKTPVVVATTANITLSGEQTIDGVLTSASRVLVKSQSTASENGIYVSGGGSWSRSSDANTGAELEGATVTVQQGTANENTTWTQTTDGVTIGSSNIVWAQFGSSVPDASSSVKGIARLYSSTSLGGATDGAPDQNAVKSYVDSAVGSVPKVIQVAISDQTLPITAGTGKITFRAPAAMNIIEVRASLSVAQVSGSIFTIDINENGASILSTKLTIDNTEKTSTTAVTPVVISDSSISDDSEITIDVDQIGNGTAVGGIVTIIYQ